MHTVGCPHCGRKIKLGKAVAKARLQCRYCMKMFVGTSQESQDEAAPSFAPPADAAPETAPPAEPQDASAEDTANSPNPPGQNEENETVEQDSANNGSQADQEDLLTKFADEEEPAAPAQPAPVRPPAQAAKPNPPPVVKAASGQAPPKVSAGQAPSRVSVGQAPAKVSAGQAPPRVSTGQAPPKVSVGQTPPRAAAGKAPKPVVKGAAPPPPKHAPKPPARESQADPGDALAALTNAADVADQSDEDPFAALADQTDDGTVSARKTTSRPPARFAAEMKAAKAPKPVVKGPAPPPPKHASKPLAKAPPRQTVPPPRQAAPPPVKEAPQQVEEDPFAALTGQQEQTEPAEEIQDLAEDTPDDIPSADETDQKASGKTYNLQDEEVADEKEQAQEEDPFAALGAAVEEKSAPSRPAKAATGAKPAKGSKKQKKGADRGEEEDAEPEKYVRRKRSILIPALVVGTLGVGIIVAIVLIIINIGGQVKPKDDQQAQNPSPGTSGESTSSTKPFKPPPNVYLPPPTEQPKPAPEASSVEVLSGSFYPINESGFFSGFIRNNGESPLQSVSLNLNLEGHRVAPVQIDYLPPKESMPYCFQQLPPDASGSGLNKDKVVVTSVTKAPNDMVIWMVSPPPNIEKKSEQGKVKVYGKVKSQVGATLNNVGLQCDVFTDTNQPAGNAPGTIDGGNTLKAGQDANFAIDVDSSIPDLVVKSYVRAYGTKSN
ncbi:MAG: hypothetical protein HZA50_09120 [Planctomycetes bacterium]|nr:hypothetical protein [Planctomycetota bacterium]